MHHIGELIGLGTSTVCEIVKEVSSIIVNRLWEKFVTNNFPTNSEKIEKALD